ncbi:G2/mitotic-specific cyclin cdc13 [Plectosphaerella cucumerina]|uniref:G2/mitotic-specific cyclin cdc13 n=1 Tax=Plectosphaerella cucumerina TaxID=40658 RepID=A0A8K0TWL6_9PEZI|nr:G2/mitotic-specific cyclin cdc13 [Plectosphaerella cucumerina]
MRFAVLDELIKAHHCFKMSQETLFLAVNYVDRFLSVHVIRASDMPLVGVVALFIAAKMEETMYPTPNALARGSASQAVSARRIVEGERVMLNRLGFELGSPGPGVYYGWARGEGPVDRTVDLLTSYFLEVTIMDEAFISCASSYLAAAALNLSRLISGKGDWTESLADTYGYRAAELDCPSFLIWLACREALARHPAVYEKYKSDTFDAISLKVQEVVRMETVGDRGVDTLPTKALEMRLFQP